MTVYDPLDGVFTLNSTEQNAAETVATGGTITGFTATFETQGSVTSGWNVTFTLRDNGSNTSPTATCNLSNVTAANTVETCTWSGTVSFNPGDYLDMMIQVTGGSSGGSNKIVRLGWTVNHT